jgi:hypothetical protein
MTPTAALQPPLMGPIIITRYLGPSNTRGARVTATHKRDSEITWRKTICWDHALDGSENHHAAALALVQSWGLGEGQEPWVLIGRGHDHDAYYFLAVQPWQLQRLPNPLTPSTAA